MGQGIHPSKLPELIQKFDPKRTGEIDWANFLVCLPLFVFHFSGNNVK
jgi:hypothetical protein